MDRKPTQIVIDSQCINFEPNDNFSFKIFDMMENMDYYFNNETTETQTNFICVLYGKCRNFHNSNHKFIETKEDFRCKKCNKFFYQHFPHINSCYDPKISVKVYD
jgi:hypothetical protein